MAVEEARRKAIADYISRVGAQVISANYKMAVEQTLFIAERQYGYSGPKANEYPSRVKDEVFLREVYNMAPPPSPPAPVEDSDEDRDDEEEEEEEEEEGKEGAVPATKDAPTLDPTPPQVQADATVGTEVRTLDTAAAEGDASKEVGIDEATGLPLDPLNV